MVNPYEPPKSELGERPPPRVELDAAEKTHARYVFLFYGLPVLAALGMIAVAAAVQFFEWLGDIHFHDTYFQP